MDEVFASWDREIMEYFIDRDADLHRGHPFAFALCHRIRTALGVYKRCREQIPELQEQANIALRHHCKEGNLKWVSLLLWAGADPFKPGTDIPGEEDLPEGDGLSALGFAALYGHFEAFGLKSIRSKLPGPCAADLLPHLTHGKGLDVLKQLLEDGLDPNDQNSGGCSAIGHCLYQMSWGHGYTPDPWERTARQNKKIDSPRSREYLKAIHLLVKHGAKWMPADHREIVSARRSLLKMTPDYTIEFVWIMSKYGGCALESIQELLRTPTMKKHLSGHHSRLQEVLAAW